MPLGKLNPNAQEWRPPAPIETQLAGLRIGGGRGRGGGAAAAGSRKQAAGGGGDGAAQQQQQQQQAAAGPSGARPAADHGGELEFEDVFERQGSPGRREDDSESASSTPRSGVSPLGAKASAHLCALSCMWMGVHGARKCAQE